jgi:hypothetical protein
VDRWGALRLSLLVVWLPPLSAPQAARYFLTGGALWSDSTTGEPRSYHRQQVGGQFAPHRFSGMFRIIELMMSSEPGMTSALIVFGN